MFMQMHVHACGRRYMCTSAKKLRSQHIRAVSIDSSSTGILTLTHICLLEHRHMYATASNIVP